MITNPFISCNIYFNKDTIKRSIYCGIIYNYEIAIVWFYLLHISEKIFLTFFTTWLAIKLSEKHK